MHSHCLRTENQCFFLRPPLPPQKGSSCKENVGVGQLYQPRKNSAALDCQGALALASSVLSQRCSSQSETPTQDLHDRKQTGKNDRRILNGGSFCFTASPPNGLHVVGACTPRKRKSKTMLKINNAMLWMLWHLYMSTYIHNNTRPERLGPCVGSSRTTPGRGAPQPWGSQA